MTLTQEQFNALPASVQESLRAGGYAPGGAQQGAGQGVPPAQVQPAQTQAQPPAQAPEIPAEPSLDAVPEQSCGPQFLPWNVEYNFIGTVAQVQYRFTTQSGPHYFATITVDQADGEANNAGIVAGTVRALIWKFNPKAYGKDVFKSDASLRRFRDFLRQLSGLPEGAPTDAIRADLIARSKTVPSLGIRVKVVNRRGGVNRNDPTQHYYDLTLVPLG